MDKGKCAFKHCLHGIIIISFHKLICIWHSVIDFWESYSLNRNLTYNLWKYACKCFQFQFNNPPRHSLLLPFMFFNHSKCNFLNLPKHNRKWFTCNYSLMQNSTIHAEKWKVISISCAHSMGFLINWKHANFASSNFLNFKLLSFRPADTRSC